jgi:hypothetical protein
VKSALVCVAGALVGAAVGLVATPRRPGTRTWQRYVALGFGAAGLALGVVAGYH